MTRSPLIANEPLGIGAPSYAGALNIGIVADRDAFADPEVFTAALREELDSLGEPASPAHRRAGRDPTRTPRGSVAEAAS